MPLLKVNQIASYSGNTLTVGTTGDTVTLASGATSSGFGATYNGAVNWTSNIVTSALTVSAGIGYFVNTSTSAITATLPASPSVGNTIIFTDYNRTFATNNLTINPNSNKFQGGTVNAVYNTNGQTVSITYADSTKGWIPIEEITATNTQSYSIDFLVVAGGGGAGQNQSGGGAGGFRTSTQNIVPGTVITVTVGDGGAKSTVSGNQGVSGSNSSISGSGLTTITSAGGGGAGSGIGGGAASDVGLAGGSGGGACSNYPAFVAASGGTGNTPSTSPSQGNNGGNGASDEATWTAGGGGGGAGAAGTNGSSGGTPNGGIGATSSITGSSVYYAGGGGATADNGGIGTGGTGGGGNAGRPAGTNGTANLGGGGGGCGTSFQGGSGGKGVVILSVPTSKYSSTSTGSPTVTTSGSNTILKFTGSGSYTA